MTNNNAAKSEATTDNAGKPAGRTHVSKKRYDSKPKPRFSKKREIDEWVSNYIADRNMVVLRHRKTGEPLACSFTEEGLKLVCNKGGRLIYFKDAILRHKQLDDGSWSPFIQSKTEAQNPDIIVEHFVPRNHYKKYWNHRTKRMEYVYRKHPGTNNFILDDEGEKVRIIDSYLQKSELRWTDKAVRLTYGIEEQYYGN